MLGILLRPLLGAIIGEFIYPRQLWLAVKAGIGIIVGSLIGNLIQGVLAIAAVVVRFYNHNLDSSLWGLIYCYDHIDNPYDCEKS